LNGIIIWGTGHRDMAENIDFSRLSDLPAPWPEEIDNRGPWQKTTLAPEGPASDCLTSEKRADAPVIFVAGTCRSAMPLAWHFAGMDCLPVWGSLICIRQLQGTGQLGRTWISPPGNLYAALRLPEAPPAFAGIMSLVTGYAILRTLQELKLAARLKWPNDIMIDGKKAGGILIQNRQGMSIAGVGLNLLSAPDAEALRADHAAEATHLAAAGYAARPLSLWERIVDRGRIFMEEILSADVPSAIGRIQAQMAFIGRTVLVDDHAGGIYPATLAGLSPAGELVLEIENETRTIRSGSIAPLPGLRKE